MVRGRLLADHEKALRLPPIAAAQLPASIFSSLLGLPSVEDAVGGGERLGGPSCSELIDRGRLAGGVSELGVQRLDGDIEVCGLSRYLDAGEQGLERNPLHPPNL